MHVALRSAGALGIVAATLFAACQDVPHATVSVKSSAQAVTHAPPFGKIKHVVVLYQENRSFDEVLGYWCLHSTKRCNGSVGPVRLRDGSVVPMTQSGDIVSPDPPHDVGAQAHAIDGGKMDGWGDLGSGCISPGTNNCLTYYTPSQIPALTAFANQYVVSDRTFSGQDSPSWGGHMWVAAPTQDGFTGSIPYTPPGPGWGCDSNAVADWYSPSGVHSTEPSCIPAPDGYLDPTKYRYDGAFEPSQVPNVPTIFDGLDGIGKPWRIYESVYIWSVCPTFAKCLYGPQHTNMVPTAQVLSDAAHGTLPAYSIIVPEGPKGGTGQHPPHSMLVGDNWIGQVVNALESGPEWSSTAVFITYDDCGCFYDHVPPGLNPDGTRQGLRQPMVIVSPYAKRGAIDSNPASFASILRFTEEAFGIAPLGVNDAKAYDYANAFDFTAAPTPPRVRPKAQPIPADTRRRLASIPADGADPT